MRRDFQKLSEMSLYEYIDYPINKKKTMQQNINQVRRGVRDYMIRTFNTKAYHGMFNVHKLGQDTIRVRKVR